jgi:hypothetical protein
MNQRFVWREFCVFADKHKICNVVVDVVGLGKCRLVVSGIFPMTTIGNLHVIFQSLL